MLHMWCNVSVLQYSIMLTVLFHFFWGFSPPCYFIVCARACVCVYAYACIREGVLNLPRREMKPSSNTWRHRLRNCLLQTSNISVCKHCLLYGHFKRVFYFLIVFLTTFQMWQQAFVCKDFMFLLFNFISSIIPGFLNVTWHKSWIVAQVLEARDIFGSQDDINYSCYIDSRWSWYGQ